MWRLKWLIKELLHLVRHQEHADVLEYPNLYAKALLLKLIPDLFKHPILFTLKAGGDFHVREFMTLFIFKEIFIQKCYDIELKNIEEPVIIDVGANIGLFALRAKQLWPCSHIFCYEPYPPNYTDLESMIIRNRLRDVQIIKKGIGGSIREAKLHIHQHNIGGHSIYTLKESTYSIDIELTDLRSALSQTPNRKCDLLKLDCEGAEHEIILSLDQKLVTRIPRIIFEVMSAEELEKSKRHLQALGYTVVPYRGIWLATR